MEKKQAVEMAFPFVMPPNDEPYEIYGQAIRAGRIAASTGMTLRDYFAAEALSALILKEKDWQNCGPDNVPKMAKWSYEYADAMLRAREAV